MVISQSIFTKSGALFILTTLMTISFSLNGFADCHDLFEGTTTNKLIFRNNPLVVPKPILFTALFREIASKSTKSSTIEPLANFLDTFNNNKTVWINNKRVTNPEALKSETEYLEQLFDDISKVTPDQISFGQVVVGADAINTHIFRREFAIAKLRSEVHSVLNEVQSDWRPAVFLNIGIDIIASPYIIIMLPFMPAFKPTVAMKWKQAGVFPVNIAEDHYYDHKFLQNNKEITNALNSNVMVPRIYSSELPITYSHFNELKNCNQNDSDILGTVQSCVALRPVSAIDMFSNRAFMNTFVQTLQAFKLDPRWASPLVKIDELLVFNPNTGEPVLMTFLRLFANKFEGKKKKKDSKEAEEKALNGLPGYKPSPVRY